MGLHQKSAWFTQRTLSLPSMRVTTSLSSSGSQSALPGLAASDLHLPRNANLQSPADGVNQKPGGDPAVWTFSASPQEVLISFETGTFSQPKAQSKFCRVVRGPGPSGAGTAPSLRCRERRAELPQGGESGLGTHSEKWAPSAICGPACLLCAPSSAAGL